MIMITVSLAAQDPVLIAPLTVEETFDVDLDQSDLSVELYTTVTNNSNEPINLRWFRREIERPESWRTQVCDNFQCWVFKAYSNFDPELGTSDPFVLQPGESFEVIFYVWPFGTAGTGSYALDFSLVENPDSVLAVVNYNVGINTTITSSQDIKREPTFRLYPNPATDYFQLTDSDGIAYLRIYNVLGKPVNEFEVSTDRRYPVYDLPAGVYLVSLHDRKGEIIRTLRLRKETMRP